MRARIASAAHASAVALLVVAVPVTLVRVGRWPRPEGSWAVLLREWIEEPLNGGFLSGVVYVTAWLLWGLLAAAITARVYAQVARMSRWLPRLHLPGPMQGLTAAVLGATAVSTAAAASPAHADVTTAASAQPARPAAAQRPAATAPADVDDRVTTRSMADDRTEDTYTVRRGDTLSSIARGCLGDADRWPEIFTANRGSRFPHVGGTLRDPDLIYPGWTLRLPPAVDAPSRAARPSARPAPTSKPAPKAPSDSPGSPSGTVADDGVVESAPPPASGPGDQRAASGPAAVPSPGTADERPSPTPAPRPRPGVSLGTGSWLDMGLVAAVLTAVALVWAHRRRRYTPRPPTSRPHLDEPGVAAMPAVVTRIRRGLRALTPIPETIPGPPVDELVVDPYPDQTDAANDGLSNSLADVSQPVVPALASPVIEVWPAAGLGLIGPGAAAAARGVLVSALAVGGLDDPGGRGHVVVASDHLATLLGAAAVTVVHTTRLTVTSGLTDALAFLEEQTLHRTRMCADYEVDTIADLRDQDPMAEPLPPIVLIADTTAAHERAHIAALLTQGQRLDIHGVLLGAWPDGDTIVVAEDGSTSPADGDANEHGRHRADVGRLTVINPSETTDLLRVLAESHTGETPPPAPAQHAPLPAADRHPGDSGSATPQRDETAAPHSTHRADTGRLSVLTPPETTDLLAALAATQTGERRAPAPTATPQLVTGQEPQPAEGDVVVTGGAEPPDSEYADGPVLIDTNSALAHPSEPRDHPGDEPHPAGDEQGAPGGGRVGVRVLGGARIVERDTTVPLRAKALELLVYLVVHDGEASQEQILDDLLPDAPAAKAPHRLHTYVSALRKALAHTGGPADYLTHPPRRYTLNRSAIDTDLWRMRDALRDAERASTHAERAIALQRAIDAYDGALADGYGYEWIESHREGIRRQALDAHLALAAATADPTRALAVLQAAIRHDPYAEVLYQQAMRVQAALGHLDEIRALRRTLIRRLEEIDADPSDDTLELADRLVAGLRRQRPDRTPHPRDGGQRP
ncbi:BTAD domain-containing putative transcriptional regulator [Micromonospora sp. DT4]|uniref:BTAD domain-containing putative transcriptional regulator n=1 Tax=Micromonospora sp. DT4 TaxID=3393438 RepID=UPI003CECD331